MLETTVKWEANLHSSLINAFAFWQGQDISNATATYFDDMKQAIGHIQDVAGDNAGSIHMANGETGWPTSMLKSVPTLPKKTC